jgi:CRISP-associated protein Cas1
MSYHLLHIFQHGCQLSQERGHIVCRSPDQPERRLPHADIRAVIIAARGVTLTSSFMSAILESDGIIVHCNDSYQACGLTAPLARITDNQAFQHQVSRPKRLNEKLWQKLLRGKTDNQRRVLEERRLSSAYLERALEKNQFDEGNCARQYWQLYFPSIGWASTGRDRKAATPPNQMLNYGYAVLAALCHRSLIVHGLSPQLGVKHIARYRSDPLVYDLMEPFRPIVDLLLAEYMTEPTVDFRGWSKKVGTELRERRLKHERYSLKLMDAIDASASSLTRSYHALSAEPFWVPVV